MTSLEAIGIVATSALFLPVLVTSTLRLGSYKSFPALLVYYFLVFGFNFLSLDFIKVDRSFLYNYGLANNFLDAPLMLSFMTYFSKTASFRHKMKRMIYGFLVFELIVIAIKGFTIGAAIIVMGPGLLIVLGLSLIFFIHQAKITIVHQKAAGKACIVASLLFAYGGYTFIYVVFYLLRTRFRDDTFLIYYLISIVSSLMVCVGIVLERKRVRQLTELQTARRELRLVYGRSDKQTVAPKKRPLWKNI